MAETELKPCPFCGGEALERGDPNARLARWVNCKTCNADMVGKTLDEAIAKWNRRTPPSTAGWLPMASAPKNAVIWVADRSGDIHKVSWGDCCPGYPASPNMKWCVAYSYGEHGYHTIDDPVAWMHPPLPPAPSQEGASEVEGQEKADG